MWILKKPADLDLHCFHEFISGLSLNTAVTYIYVTEYSEGLAILFVRYLVWRKKIGDIKPYKWQLLVTGQVLTVLSPHPC